MREKLTLPKLLKKEIKKRANEMAARERIERFAIPLHLDFQKLLRDNDYVGRRIMVEEGDNNFKISLFQDDDGDTNFFCAHILRGGGRYIENILGLRFNVKADCVAVTGTLRKTEARPATVNDLKDFREVFNFFKSRLSEVRLEERSLIKNEDMPLVRMENGHHVSLDEIDDGF